MVGRTLATPVERRRHLLDSPLLAAEGKLASTLGFGPDQHPAAIAIMADPNSATLDRLAADVATGHIRVPVTATSPLPDVAKALTDYAAGTLGKLAITLG